MTDVPVPSSTNAGIAPPLAVRLTDPPVQNSELDGVLATLTFVMLDGTTVIVTEDVAVLPDMVCVAVKVYVVVTVGDAVGLLTVVEDNPVEGLHA